MKKIWYRIQSFWMMHFRNKVQFKKDIGSFSVRFREYDMEIASLSRNFRLSLRADAHAFGYLASALKVEKEENVQGYATIMYLLATEITKDRQLNKDVVMALERYNRRMTKLAEKAVSQSPESSQTDLAAVASDTAAGTATRRERRAAKVNLRKAFRKDRDAISKMMSDEQK